MAHNSPQQLKVWSAQQDAIFDWFARGAGNLVVRARAGTGKTTTILEALVRAECKSAVLCAFNKRIAEELNARMVQPAAGGKAEAKTLHAIGFGFVRNAFRGVRVDGKRGLQLAAAACPPEADRETVAAVAKLASLAKSCIVPSHDQGAPAGDLVDLAERFGIESEQASVDELAVWARAALRLAADVSDTIDFDDMVWLPLALGLTKAWYDLVVVDEAQDMSPVQIELARRICKRGGRIAVVGDDRQAIYGFRGADSGSIDRLKAELNARELPLTVTYRCGRAIVAAAAQIVPDFVAAESNGPGEICNLDKSELEDAVLPGDFVLSRANAPLAPICLSLLRAGRRAVIQGRDIGASLIALVKKLCARAEGIEQFHSRLSAWRAKECARLDTLEGAGKDVEHRRQYVDDQHDTLLELSAGLASTAELIARIEALFADTAPGGAVVCSTVHKAKGLEAETVYVLRDTFGAGKRRADPEAANIMYVAITRAKRRLVWVQ